MLVGGKDGQLRGASSREEFVKATAGIYDWNRISEEFGRAYAVMYENEEELLAAMDKFDPDLHLVTQISKNTQLRRAEVDRILKGPPKPPYPTETPFHFEDIKYFLGNTPIDFVLYGVEDPSEGIEGVVGVLFRNVMQSLIKKRNTGNLAYTALKNVGVEIGRVIGLTWDDTYGDKINLRFVQEVGRPQLDGRLQLEERTIRDKVTLEKGLVILGEKYSEHEQRPMIILENKIGPYGTKHKALQRELSRAYLGLAYGTLVFNFVGEKGSFYNPKRPTGVQICIKNELTLL